MKLAVSNFDGLPSLETTWSGTPHEIIACLKYEGWEVYDLWSQVQPPFDKYARIFHHFVGKHSDQRRDPIERYSRAYQVQLFAHHNECQDILHTGTLDLPMLIADRHQRHFLFCDTTWNAWIANADNINISDQCVLKMADHLEKQSYRQMKHIFTIAEYVKDDLIHHYQIPPEKITPVGTGCGKISPWFGDKDYSNGLILFVAKQRFSDKGGHLLLQGFADAVQTNPGLQLVIVGGEDYRDKYANIPNVQFTGFLTWDKLQYYFNQAALFAMPAINEPWGLVYLEALKCKIPVLGLKRNALPEITCNGKYGFLVENPKPENITRELLKAFSNVDMLQRMGIDGQKHVLGKYTWQQTSNLISERIQIEARKDNKKLRH